MAKANERANKKALHRKNETRLRERRQKRHALWIGGENAEGLRKLYSDLQWRKACAAHASS